MLILSAHVGSAESDNLNFLCTPFQSLIFLSVSILFQPTSSCIKNPIGDPEREPAEFDSPPHEINDNGIGQHTIPVERSAPARLVQLPQGPRIGSFDALHPVQLPKRPRPIRH